MRGNKKAHRKSRGNINAYFLLTFCGPFLRLARFFFLKNEIHSRYESILNTMNHPTSLDVRNAVGALRCEGIFKSGNNKGKQCSAKCQPNTFYCGRHQAQNEPQTSQFMARLCIKCSWDETYVVAMLKREEAERQCGSRCNATLKSGPRKGQKCAFSRQSDSLYCGRHDPEFRNRNIRREEIKEEIKIEEVKIEEEIKINTKCVFEDCDENVFKLDHCKDHIFHHLYEQECAICMSDFKEKVTTIKILTCGHYYHEQCILSWKNAYYKNTCPLCRRDIAWSSVIKMTAFDPNALRHISSDMNKLKISLADFAYKFNGFDLDDDSKYIKMEETEWRHIPSSFRVQKFENEAGVKYVLDGVYGKNDVVEKYNHNKHKIILYHDY